MRKHDDAHRPLQGRGQRGNRAGVPANWGGAELVENKIETCAACCMSPCRCDQLPAGVAAPMKEQQMIDATKYPQLARMQEVQDTSQAIGEFLEWLDDQGIGLASVIRGEGHDRWAPVTEGTEKLLARHFEIDLNAVERERRAVLAAHVAGVPAGESAALAQVLDALRIGKVACEWAGENAMAQQVAEAYDAARALAGVPASCADFAPAAAPLTEKKLGELWLDLSACGVKLTLNEFVNVARLVEQATARALGMKESQPQPQEEQRK